MEQNTSSVSSKTAWRPRKKVPPLWAAPLFVAGVAVLIWVFVARPFLNSPERQPARNLAAARELLDRPDGDAEEAATLAKRALDHPEYLPDRIGEAYFLLGSAEAREAGQAPPEQCGRLWTDALAHLTEAEKQGVPDDDRQKLIYRLGKVGYFAKDDPRRVLDHLTQGIAEADDRAEGYDLLTQAILRMPEPDLQAALQANYQLRQVAVDDQLAAARLLGGELCLQLHHADEARTVLERINPPAPAAIVFKARVLRARSYQQDGDWAKASGLWQSVLSDKPDVAGQQGTILYNLGLCYLRLEQAGEAAKYWERCLAKTGDSAEGSACALALAELSLHGGQIDRALGLFARAVEKTPEPSSWTNALIERGKAVERFERSSQQMRQRGQFDAALHLAASYERIAAVGKANAMRGEIWTEYAQAGEKLLRESNPLAAGVVLTPDKVNDRYRQAGAAYLQAANQVADAADKASYLWLSMQRFLSGRERIRAATVFDQLQRVDPRSPHLGEGWYLLGESHRLVKDEAAAESAYLESIKYTTHFAYRARLELAQFALERKQEDDAEAILQQNLNLLRFDRDDEAQERTLFAIGNLFFIRRNYKAAADRLEEALDRFPDDPEAIKARFNLAQSYQQLADPKNATPPKGYQTEDYRALWTNETNRLLKRAAEEFEKLGPLGENPKAEAQLDRDVLIKIAFNAAECRLMTGQYAEALRMFEKNAEYFAKPQRTTEEQEYYRVALGGTVRCMLFLNGDKKYRDAILRRAAELQLLLDDVDEETRGKWTQWLQNAKDEAEGRKKKKAE